DAGNGTIEFANFGTFQLGGSNRIADASSIKVNGATFNVQTFSEEVAGVTLTGNGNINGSGAGTLKSDNQFQLEKGSVTAILDGSTGITKTTGDAVTLSGSNTFTGGVTIAAGVLGLGNAGALNSTTPNAVSFSASSTGTL